MIETQISSEKVCRKGECEHMNLLQLSNAEAVEKSRVRVCIEAYE